MNLRTMSRPTVRLAVVGDASFQARVQAAAPRIGGTVVTPITPSRNGRFEREVVQALTSCDEFVIDAAALANFAALDADVIGRTRAIRIAHGDGDFAAGTRIEDPFAPPLSRGHAVLKRMVDIAIASAALLLTLPVLVAAAIAIRFDSRGPVLFRQTRLGVNARPFTLYKLRTMHVENDSELHLRFVHALIDGTGTAQNGLFKIVEDPRITRVGRILRHYSIDELPQLINVILGHMSLVGPRPPLPGEVRKYNARAWGRLRGKPGVTGLWQVSGRSELDFWQMVELDLDYLRRSSPWLDLRILLRTPIAVLSGRGAV